MRNHGWVEDELLRAAAPLKGRPAADTWIFAIARNRFIDVHASIHNHFHQDATSTAARSSRALSEQLVYASLSVPYLLGFGH